MPKQDYCHRPHTTIVRFSPPLPTYRLLNAEPNNRMTRFTFIKTLVVSTLLKGNGFAYIERDKCSNAKALHYIPSDLVTIIPPKTLGDNIVYSVTGISNLIEACNMIAHLKFYL